jgi:hypothetical protein
MFRSWPHLSNLESRHFILLALFLHHKNIDLLYTSGYVYKKLFSLECGKFLDKNSYLLYTAQSEVSVRLILRIKFE